MNRVDSDITDGARRRRRLTAEVKRSMRDLRIQLSMLNLRVGAKVNLRDIDLDCLDLIARQGPISPSALARQAGLHPATLTGILDRLERGGWLARERDPSDRRAVILRLRHERVAELVGLYSGMNASMDEVCAGYSDEDLELLVGFLRRTTDAGHRATEDLAAH